ncbi:hypothetical protein BO85DRAFT_511985 [Aspergillus piperis CBS 112811]|uniref:DNA2/NAM7 helicase helicase domain-containing protein n=1 Tax=Aspergillus piperis CBS 112811 TaxID=1448313 RepID=A0A8G1R4S7_9EURO|nr:hypothetical protein BO85DRAFT_511985 [Aspergillus piperis CBS 112811]RAH59268.1 hypothetical protein BO85DRAFT_511985 [Aspergillus piperis CBS 112811]
MSIDDYQARYQLCIGSTDKILLQSQPFVTGVFRPELIVIDEAARASEADLWPVFANYGPRGYLMIGDPFQLHPVVESTPQNSPLYAVSATSIFRRLHMNGMLLCMVDVQYRMASMLGDLVSQLFYQGWLCSLYPLPSALQTMSGRIADLNHALFGALPPRGDDPWQLLPFMCWKQMCIIPT